MRRRPSLGRRARAAAGTVAVAATTAAAACGAPPETCAQAGTCVDVAGGGEVVTRTPDLVPEQVFDPPVPRPAAISSTFGPRWKKSAGRYDFHPGLDYFDALGTPVTAIGPGVVEGVYPDGSATYPLGGNVVVVRHPLPEPRTFHGVTVDRIFAVYLHLASFAVATGDPVVAGQPVGAMGMSGDTDFVHLHFELRAQTTCQLPYQVAHPDSTCATGFDPNVHPFLFLRGAPDDDAVTVEPLPTATGFAVRYRATRGDLDLDAIETEGGALGFDARAGIDARATATLDRVEFGWVRLDPRPFGSDSTEIAYDLYFPTAPRVLELRDLHGRGVRFVARAAGADAAP